MSECKYEVKPFPKEWCVGCCANGCYPWNKNQFLLCQRMGGFYPAAFVKENDVDVRCLNYSTVTFELWNAHFSDLKREAQLNEESRLRAMKGKVFSNQPLPGDFP